MASNFDELRTVVRGQILTPEDLEYDAARRVYNGMIDRRPALVLRAAGVADVMAGVRFARESGLDISIRGGSHSAPGFGTNDGGMVIDLSRMKSVRVDPSSQTARAEGGCNWGDFYHATHAFGLSTTGGIVSTTGIGGLTLGGGIGHLARRYGLTIDNLVSADVVLADGRFVVASEREHPDLFWALRGGGGNFGVVTSFEYRLHPVHDVLVGVFFYELSAAKAILEFFREFIVGAPEELNAFFAFLISPPLPFVPEARHGEKFCALVSCWSGHLDLGEEALRPLRAAGPVAAEMVAPMPFPMLNSMFDPLIPPGLQQYWKTVLDSEIPDGAVAAHIEHGPKVPTLNSTMHIYPISGAVSRVPADATAFSARDARFATVIPGAWPDPADNEKNIRWVREYYEALRPHAPDGAYVNFMSDDEGARVEASYGGNYHRLASIKRRYDPDNLFHLNQNIPPA
jgi:FAD/FMN-containing dehydrogenase